MSVLHSDYLEANNESKVTPVTTTAAGTPIPDKFLSKDTGELNLDALLESTQTLEDHFDKAAGVSEQADDPNAHRADVHLTADGEAGQEDANLTDATDEQIDEIFEVPEITAASVEWDETGTLSDETFASLEGVGFSRDLVERYIAGVELLSANAYQAAYADAGGSEESYSEMALWARNTLSEDELGKYNYLVSDPATQSHAIQGLYARFDADRDVEPELISGAGTGSESGTAGFATSKEMITAIQNPRYATDANYRAEVEKKIAAASRAGVRLYG